MTNGGFDCGASGGSRLSVRMLSANEFGGQLDRGFVVGRPARDHSPVALRVQRDRQDFDRPDGMSPSSRFSAGSADEHFHHQGFELLGFHHRRVRHSVRRNKGGRLWAL